MKEAYAVRRTVPPSAEIQARIDKLLAKGMVDDPQKMLSELARLGARLIIQRAVEDEFDTWLGRARYERRPERQRGLRNGFRPRRLQTAEGELRIERASDDAALRAELRRFSKDRPRWGYRRAHHRLGELGWEVNRKRVQRVWREEGLRVPERRRKRRRLGDSTVPAQRLRAQRLDEKWGLRRADARWSR
jgi:hypothetical protein